jgi:hypothetical protein
METFRIRLVERARRSGSRPECYPMPRTARASAGGYCFHILNRGNARSEVFHRSPDYDAFLDILTEASVRLAQATVGLLPDVQPAPSRPLFP